MKIDQLLAKYLYEHKEVNLPGIGRFTLDANTVIPEDNDKQKSTLLSGIHYTKKTPSNLVDEKLVDFVRTHTGKIKPLAHSDIESYISLCTQLLNIGNPLYIDGIGTLIKNKEGDFMFTPGLYNFQKLEEPTLIKENTEQTRRSAFDESYNRQEPTSKSLKGIIVAVLGILTLALVGWGAYYLYNNNSPVKETQLPNSADSVITLSSDTLISNQPVTDSVSLKPDSTVIVQRDTYKFIIETTDNKTRAIKRYNQLINYKLPVQLETLDSINFKILMQLKASASDTLRIKDSLSKNFGKPVIVE